MVFIFFFIVCSIIPLIVILCISNTQPKVINQSLNLTKIGLLGSCQLHIASKYFFTPQLIQENNLDVKFSLALYHYELSKDVLDYNIFENLDILIVENNNYSEKASSEKIIKHCLRKNIKIIRTCLLKMPIYPINWSGFGENKSDYDNWVDLEKIDYVTKFEKCLDSLYNSIENTDLSIDLFYFVKENFTKKLLFTHSLHPTNILLYELYRHIFYNLDINIEKYTYKFDKEIILCWTNPLTTKMIKDLNIQFDFITDDDFYVNRYNQNKTKIISTNIEFD